LIFPQGGLYHSSQFADEDQRVYDEIGYTENVAIVGAGTVPIATNYSISSVSHSLKAMYTLNSNFALGVLAEYMSVTQRGLKPFEVIPIYSTFIGTFN